MEERIKKIEDRLEDGDAKHKELVDMIGKINDNQEKTNRGLFGDEFNEDGVVNKVDKNTRFRHKVNKHEVIQKVNEHSDYINKNKNRNWIERGIFLFFMAVAALWEKIIKILS